MFSQSLIVIVIQRLWQGFAGFLTVIFVARYLSSIEQGWYYTFLSVAALYSIFEMGLSAVLVQVSAHLFTRTRWTVLGRVEGSGANEFASFFHQALKSFTSMAIIFCGSVLVFGCAYFYLKSEADYGWLMPWIILVTFTAINMWMLVFFSIIEGSGKVKEVYSIRFLQGFLGALGCWLCLLMGLGLWASVAAPLLSAILAAIWLLLKWSNLFENLNNKNNDFSWKERVWPIQWRVGIGWIGNYLMSQLSTPVVFYFHGAVAAGQIGLSLTIAHMVGVFSQSWFTQSIPQMAHFVVEKDWLRLRRVFNKNLLGYCVTFLTGCSIVLLISYFLKGTPYENRILSQSDLFFLFIFVFFYQLNLGFALQLRAFNQEPLAWIAAVGGVVIFLGTLFVVSSYGTTGVVAAMMYVEVFAISPLMFYFWVKTNRLLQH
jgi:O-antigen/teichoic acid export membrane protein